MDENEREFDRCPMYFNDGADPWNIEENHIRIFDFQDYNVATNSVVFSSQLLLALIFTTALRAFMYNNIEWIWKVLWFKIAKTSCV